MEISSPTGADQNKTMWSKANKKTQPAYSIYSAQFASVIHLLVLTKLCSRTPVRYSLPTV